MNIITKKSAFGLIGIAAAGVLAVGIASPAMASTSHDQGKGDTSSYSSTSWNKSYTHVVGDVSNDVPLVIAPQIGVGDVLSDGILNGGVANGNEVANGNAVASGNEAPVASGNQVTAPVASGNQVTAPVTAPVASGNDTAVGSGNDTAVGNGSGNGNSVGTSVSDLVDVNGLVDGVLNSIHLDAILQGR